MTEDSKRVAQAAKQWYEQAAATRDRALLLRIVDLLFSSSYADQALLALGEAWEEVGLRNAPHAAKGGFRTTDRPGP